MHCTRMESSYHVDWNSIVWRKGAVQRMEIGRPFLAAKGFNTNLIHFLWLYHIIINVHFCISNVPRHKTKKVLCAQQFLYKKLQLWRPAYFCWSMETITGALPEVEMKLLKWCGFMQKAISTVLAFKCVRWHKTGKNLGSYVNYSFV